MRVAILIYFLFSLSIFASEWNIGVNDINYFLTSSGGKYNFIIHPGSSDPQFIIEESIKDGSMLKRVVYLSAEKGTSEIIKEYRAVIYDASSGKYLGDFPYKNEELKNKKWVPQKWPYWKIEGNVLLIEDPYQKVKESIKLF